MKAGQIWQNQRSTAQGINLFEIRRKNNNGKRSIYLRTTDNGQSGSEITARAYFFRSTFFRHEETFTTKDVDVDFRKGSRKVAPFVSRLVGGKVVPNTGYQTKTYTPPLVAPEKVTTVDDLLIRRPGESLYSGRTPAERAVLKMADDFKELREQILRREELMCAQTIFTGTIPIIGDGVNEVIDFSLQIKRKSQQQRKSGLLTLPTLSQILSAGTKQYRRKALSTATFA